MVSFTDLTMDSVFDLAGLSTEDFIDQILARFHEVHRRQFPEAIALARQVEAVRAGHPSAPIGLADHLSIMADRLEGHQQKEERILFPLLRKGDVGAAAMPMARMSAEHRDVGDELRRLSELTNGFRVPDGACGAWRALVEACRDIRDHLTAHMSAEDDELFARFRGGGTGGARP